MYSWAVYIYVYICARHLQVTIGYPVFDTGIRGPSIGPA
jgi:hypothetical protein